MMQTMKTQKSPFLDLDALNARLRRWQGRHDTWEKVAADHRKVLLERVAHSMAFENEPVGMERLRRLLRRGKQAAKP
jgi:hypothetical protein